jgi:hypothetical protein
VRLEAALGALAVGPLVVHPHPPPVPHRRHQRQQHLGARRGQGPGDHAEGVADRGDLRPHLGREDPVERREGAQGLGVQALDARGGGQPQPHRDRDRLVRAQQQRRQLAARPQLVAAAVPGGGQHRVAHLAQPVHVAPHGPHGHLQLGGQLGTAPHRA